MVSGILTYDQHKYVHPSGIVIDLSDQTFIKYDIFEVSVNLTPRGTHIGIVAQYG